MAPNIKKNTILEREATLIPGDLEREELPEPVANANTNKNTTAGSNTKENKSTNSKKCCRSPSWREVSHIEPHFNIGLIIDSTDIKDAHVSAMNKPASCSKLTSLVVLNPNKSTTASINDSVGKWFESNKVAADVEHLDFIGTGKEGCEKMLRSDSIHAVYIIVHPGYV